MAHFIFKSALMLAVTTGGYFAHQPAAYSLDEETMTEIRRLDQRIGGYADNIQQLMRDVRSLERRNDKLQEELEEAQEAAKLATDTMQRMQNTDIANLIATDKQLAQRVNAISEHIDNQTGTWNWGSKSRGCEDVGEHQQIQTVRSADGQFSLRYLCYDGRAIHLGTEVNLPPQ